MTFYLDTSTGKTIGIAALKARVDTLNSMDLQEKFTHWMTHTSSFVFDCTELDFVDSSGLGAIVSCLRRALEKNGDLKLAGLNQKVSMVFDITKARKLFSIFPDMQEALKSFTEPLPAQS